MVHLDQTVAAEHDDDGRRGGGDGDDDEGRRGDAEVVPAGHERADAGLENADVVVVAAAAGAPAVAA